MPNALKITAGDRFGRLTIVREIGGRSRRFECLCDCGNTTEKYLGNLRNKGKRGATTSCGCLRVEVTIERSTTHGLGELPEYSVWCGIRKRCLNPESDSYQDYGGRGIAICSEWDDFATFFRDMGSRPSGQHTIERNDVNGNYEPSNCRWATRKEQNRNTRANTILEIGGNRKCVGEWDEILSSLGFGKPGKFKSMYYRKGLDVAISTAQLWMATVEAERQCR